MLQTIPDISPEKEKERIVSFLKKTFHSQKISHTVIGLSGGVDSATSLYLLKEAIPEKNIIVCYLYYLDSHFKAIEEILYHTKIAKQNRIYISIKPFVDQFKKGLQLNAKEKLRVGNIMARVRMTILFDFAKKHNTLVCGTENKSEHYLGYFTRYGDEASDIEPIRHLYKTQIYELAKYMKVPQIIRDSQPTAGLWKGQTDEGQFGFSYKEADPVLYLHFEKHRSIEEIISAGYPKAEKIINYAKNNEFKHQVPYRL